MRDINDIFDVGVSHFNESEYVKSAEVFQKGIEQLEGKNKKNDDDYRLLVEFYINLKDAYAFNGEQVQAKNAFLKALQTFNLIQVKTARELALGNAENNFQAFHEFYQSKLTGSKFMKGEEFRENQTKLYCSQRKPTAIGTLLSEFSTFSHTPIEDVFDSMQIEPSNTNNNRKTSQ